MNEKITITYVHCNQLAIENDDGFLPIMAVVPQLLQLYKTEEGAMKGTTGLNLSMETG